jgi:hypothetical protein
MRVSPIFKLSGIPDYGIPSPDPRSIYPLSSTEFVEPPLENVLGYATARRIYIQEQPTVYLLYTYVCRDTFESLQRGLKVLTLRKEQLVV